MILPEYAPPGAPRDAPATEHHRGPHNSRGACGGTCIWCGECQKWGCVCACGSPGPSAPHPPQSFERLGGYVPPGPTRTPQDPAAWAAWTAAFVRVRAGTLAAVPPDVVAALSARSGRAAGGDGQVNELPGGDAAGKGRAAPGGNR